MCYFIPVCLCKSVIRVFKLNAATLSVLILFFFCENEPGEGTPAMADYCSTDLVLSATGCRFMFLFHVDYVYKAGGVK